MAVRVYGLEAGPGITLGSSQPILISAAATGGVGTIEVDETFTIAPSGGDFTEPGAFMDWLGRYRIMPGVMVTADIANGTYVCTKAIRGHIDGQRLVWTNSGLNGAALVGADFASLDAIWVIDPNTGITSGSYASAKAAAKAIVDAKYNVKLQFGTLDEAVVLDGKHSGDWTDCKCLFENIGTCSTGVITGTGLEGSIGDGPGGVGVFNGSCFFGFDNGNLVIDYGGIINIEGTVSLFAGGECCRADFTGGFYGSDAIIIGGGSYGFRANHGGFAYLDGVYIRGCNIGLESTNSPSMYWAHNGDIQYNYIGIQTTWGGSGKVFAASVKNNARMQIAPASDGVIDARSLDGASTALFAGAPPLFGINIVFAGSVDLLNGTLTGHNVDISLAGTGVVRAQGATYGTAVSGGSPLSPLGLSGLFLAPGNIGRVGYGLVEMSGTTLTLPAACPLSVGVVQPAGSAGTAITIDTIDNTNLASGQMVTLLAANAASGELVTLNDSTNLALAAPVRYLGNIRDMLTLIRPQNTALLAEIAYKRNLNNSSGDQKRVRVATSTGGLPVTIDDDVLVVNKTTGSVSAVSMDAGLNFSGRELIVKDGKGDAATNNITITPGGGQTIDGAATYVINTNYGRIRLIHNATQWNVLGT